MKKSFIIIFVAYLAIGFVFALGGWSHQLRTFSCTMPAGGASEYVTIGQRSFVNPDPARCVRRGLSFHSFTQIPTLTVLWPFLIVGQMLDGSNNYDTPPQPTTNEMKTLRPANFDTPNVPRCYPVANYRIVMRLDDSNSPLCITMSEKQIVEFWNATDEKMTITFADRTEEVKADKRLVFGEPVGEFLAEGVHRATIAEQPDRIVEVYALTMDTLREACAHSEIPAQGEKDTAQDQLSPLVVVRWTDERGGENIVPLIYEPETDFAGCSESAKEFLRHLPTGPNQ